MELQPICKKHNNRDAFGYETDSTAVKGGKIKDLRLTDDGQALASFWKCPSVWERVKFLFHGEITVRLLVRKQPPIAVVMGDVYKSDF